MNALTISDLHKSYGKNSVLASLQMHIREGEIYGLLGPNGAGKSTLMGIILGLIPYDEGYIDIFGLDMDEAKEKLSRKINALPEFFGLYEWMKAAEYLHFFAALYDILVTDESVAQLLRDVGLSPTDRKPIGTYSQGMKKRLGLARALINDPRLLILDEPTSGLDPKGRREIHDLLLRLNREKGTTILLSTHILDDVERLCGRIGILYDKSLQYEGALDQKTEALRYRYRFELSDPQADPFTYNSEHVHFISKKETWIECEIEGVEPSDAIAELGKNGVRFNQAIALSGSLEHLYFHYTQKDAV